tara:strand:- start:696 stop:950 length:255 start_codon:yes stop_codon:yes gene_type:complete
MHPRRRLWLKNRSRAAAATEEVAPAATPAVAVPVAEAAPAEAAPAEEPTPPEVAPVVEEEVVAAPRPKRTVRPRRTKKKTSGTK